MTQRGAKGAATTGTERVKKTQSAPVSRRAVAQRLQSLRAAGVTHIPKPRKRAATTCQTESVSPATEAPARKPSMPVTGDRANNLTTAKKSPPPAGGDSLELICKEVAACRQCDELARTRNTTVFGEGNPHARLVFMGEAPGADEDRQGRPFVGRAGQLLTKIIEACTLRREDVYILNTLKCRPPGNRNPLPSEAANCRGYLDRQLALIGPEYICCLGAVAAQNLLETDTSIGRLRGSFLDYKGIKVLCTYHPAYLLRNPPAKRMVWDDMQILMAAMGIELPGKKG